MSDQDDIDYEALAKALYESSKTDYGRSVDPAWGDWKPDIQRHLTETHVRMARAVVAAYLEQRAARGVREVSAADVAVVVGWLRGTVRSMPLADLAALDRVRGEALIPDAG